MTEERILLIKLRADKAMTFILVSALAPAVVALFSVSTMAVIAEDSKETNIGIIAPASNQSLDTVPLLLGSKNENVIENGAVLLAPKEDTVVDTPYGTVSVGAGSVALVAASEPCLGVYDLLAKGSIEIKTGSGRITIMPGHCAVLTKLTGRSFEEINPCQAVGYRSLACRSVGGGIQIYESEFAVTSMVHALPPLQVLIHSEKPDVRKTMARVMKTDMRRSQLLRTSKPFCLYLNPPVKERPQLPIDEWLWPK